MGIRSDRPGRAAWSRREGLVGKEVEAGGLWSSHTQREGSCPEGCLPVGPDLLSLKRS